MTLANAISGFLAHCQFEKNLSQKKRRPLFIGSPSGNDQANFVVNYPNNFNAN